MDLNTTEIVIKLKQDQNWLLGQDNLCFICLLSICPSNNEENPLLNFLFNYLKISEFKGTTACEKCGETLSKLVKLFSDLEKVQLEIDYFLGLIQNTIFNSWKSGGNAFGFQSVRESFAAKCREKIKCPKAKVVLENVSNLIKNRSSTPISDCSDGPPNLDDDDYSNQSLIKSSVYLQSTPDLNVEMLTIKKEVNCERMPAPDGISEDSSCAIPVLDVIQTIKIESKLENITSKWIKCPRCYKRLRNPENLRKHYKIAHLRLKPKVKCSKCVKTFTTRQTLRKHIDAHHSHLNPYKCDLCDEPFAKFKDLQRHNQTDRHKSKENDKRLNCDLCDKTFDHFKALNWHKRDVHPKKLFPCEVCGKMFKRKGDMKDHVLGVHEKRREFYCQVEGCDCRYFKPYELAKHYRLKHPDFSVPPKANKEPIQSSFKGNPDNVTVDEIFKEIRILNLDDK